MPRIDPLQLLRCLSVLLTPEGGILSQEEVPRLVNLMSKFSKKLVSKCVYILILKSTDQSLVDSFMSEGGWNLIHTWLQDAIHISNWDLVREILTLILITPVDVERLKLNSIPKLVKSLSRLEEEKGVQELASQLVHDWLVIVKGSSKIERVQQQTTPVEIIRIETEPAGDVESSPNDTVDSTQIQGDEGVPCSTFYKVTVRDGKQVISRTADKTTTDEEEVASRQREEGVDAKVSNDKRDKSRLSDRSRSRSSSSKHNSSSSKSKSSSSKDKHRSSSSSSSKSSRKDRDRDKERQNGGVKSSSTSSSNKDPKERQAEKDKDTLAKIKPQSIDKLGRIPKKSGDDKVKEVKKPTMSIEVRKNNEERPKTVKVFNSKRRSTGLEEEARPPPPRPVKKTSAAAAALPIVQKRASPTKELSAPPEKKPKVEVPAERPGAIKLIPPKPKPPVLQESDLFMDALAASATVKKDPKKRKRRPSQSKDTPTSPTTSQNEPSSPVTSPLGLKNIAAPNFYQDTLNSNDTSNNSEENNTDNPDEETKVEERPGTPMDTDEIIDTKTKEDNGDGLKGVLVLAKRRGPKKSVKFNDDNLTQVRFFELDETERVNVTRTFMDMAKMEMSSEREAFQMSRKLPNEDTMEALTMWRFPYLIDLPEPLAGPGSKSLEKDIQFAREKSVLQALYFDKRKIPDSPEEPDPENHQMRDPIMIPLEDSESQEMDLRNTPWPEPKGSPPPQIHPENMPHPQMFPNIQNMPFQNFGHPGPAPPFQGMPPRFNGPPVVGPPFPPPNMMPNGNMMGGPNMGPNPDMMPPHQGPPLNPTAFGHDNFNHPMMGDNNFGPQGPPFNHGNMGMFPPNNFRGGRGGFRRGGGNNPGPWIRMNGPGNWNNRGGGNRGGGGGRICKNVKNHGFCRHMDKCPFIHPNK